MNNYKVYVHVNKHTGGYHWRFVGGENGTVR